MVSPRANENWENEISLWTWKRTIIFLDPFSSAYFKTPGQLGSVTNTNEEGYAKGCILSITVLIILITFKNRLTSHSVLDLILQKRQ